MKKDLSVIFENEPRQWGLRGDQYMWQELKEENVGKEFPLTDFALAEIVARKFEEVSGVPLTIDATPYVERYAHGGMSSGHLSGLFRMGKGIYQVYRNYYEADKASKSEE